MTAKKAFTLEAMNLYGFLAGKEKTEINLRGTKRACEKSNKDGKSKA